uniref:Uncharacterized protein n=1 Tax=Ciona intestinalis TaxID=7719 RepID=H2XQR6_CIOIN
MCAYVSSNFLPNNYTMNINVHVNTQPPPSSKPGLAESPVLVGVGVVLIFLSCVLYHLCYKRFCAAYSADQARRYEATAGLVSSQARLTTPNQGENNRGHCTPDNSSLPEYSDLPPSYMDVLVKISDAESQTDLPPPPYEESKSTMQTVV